jgi:Holliday junction resolvase
MWYNNKNSHSLFQATIMSQATELTNQIIDFVYRQGGYAWRASSTGVYDQQRQSFRTSAKKGVADVLACLDGRLIAIEVKIGKDRLSAEQEGFLANIKHAGGLAFVAKDFDSFQDEWKTIFSVR